MKTLIESIFGSDIIKKDINITNVDTACQLVVSTLEDALHMKAHDAIKEDLSDVIWDPDEWYLVYCSSDISGFTSAVIYLQYNKSRVGCESTFPVRLTVYIDLDKTNKDNLVCVNVIECGMYEDWYYQFCSSVRAENIEGYTGLKDRFFKTNNNQILEYLRKLFIKFKKSVSKGDFDNVFENTYLKTYATNGHKYEQIAHDELNKLLKKLVK